MVSMGFGKFKCAKCRKLNYAGNGCKVKKCEWCGTALRLFKGEDKADLVTGVKKRTPYSEVIKEGFGATRKG